MTKKHYHALAAALRATQKDFEHSGPLPLAVLEVCAQHIADYLATDNPRFVRSRFLAACKGKG